MSKKNLLVEAFSKLNAAIETLEQRMEARLERESALEDAEAEVQRMGADRVRLAESLDAAQARSMQLEHVNKEVSRRLVDAMETIRKVVDSRHSA